MKTIFTLFERQSWKPAGHGGTLAQQVSLVCRFSHLLANYPRKSKSLGTCPQGIRQSRRTYTHFACGFVFSGGTCSGVLVEVTSVVTHSSFELPPLRARKRGHFTFVVRRRTTWFGTAFTLEGHMHVCVG